jgi:hypothetical protein
MKDVKLYLEGPGRECRPVTFVSTEEVCARTLVIVNNKAKDERIEINILADSQGHLARQIDREGFRYKFEGSEIPWTLIIE